MGGVWNILQLQQTEGGEHYVQLRCHMTVKQLTSNRGVTHIDFK